MQLTFLIFFFNRLSVTRKTRNVSLHLFTTSLPIKKKTNYLEQSKHVMHVFINCLSFNLINKNLHQKKKIKQRKYVAAQLHYITRWDMFWPSTSFSFLKFVVEIFSLWSPSDKFSTIDLSHCHKPRPPSQDKFILLCSVLQESILPHNNI